MIVDFCTQMVTILLRGPPNLSIFLIRETMTKYVQIIIFTMKGVQCKILSCVKFYHTFTTLWVVGQQVPVSVLTHVTTRTIYVTFANTACRFQSNFRIAVTLAFALMLRTSRITVTCWTNREKIAIDTLLRHWRPNISLLTLQVVFVQNATF